MRLALSPKSVTDVEGVREMALALKATTKTLSKRKDNGNSNNNDGGSTEGEGDEELQPLVKEGPRYSELAQCS